MNKKKIFNDPVYGFITISSDLIFEIIEHPYFQRLRRIKQVGLSDYVYPGAHHTRFSHALGAMHLMGVTLNNLRSKGHKISDEEFEAAQIAILLHDIGHGPFSHTLENSILSNVHHEDLSLLIMEQLDTHFDNQLGLAIKMFIGKYRRKFFHQLVSSQLDIDRIDYLNRDSFFTGVSEGTIGAERIIKMLEVKNDNIVVEEKGIYSIENFLSARRLMYWQVYLHKTSVSAEILLSKIIARAKALHIRKEKLFTTPALALFLEKKVSLLQLKKNPTYIEHFCQLDDHDIWAVVKIWINHSDKILSSLCSMLINRKLFKVTLSNKKFSKEQITKIEKNIAKKLKLQKEDLQYFIEAGSLTNAAYVSEGQSINILTKTGKVIDVAEASDLPNIKAMSKIVKKYYLCYPKNVYLS